MPYGPTGRDSPHVAVEAALVRHLMEHLGVKHQAREAPGQADFPVRVSDPTQRDRLPLSSQLGPASPHLLGPITTRPYRKPTSAR